MRSTTWCWRVAWLVLSFGLGASGCFQELDSRASSETAAASAPPSDMHTVDLMTPPIGITSGDNGQTTDDACAAVTFVAMSILRANCAACHGGGPGQNLGQPPFDFVLDVNRLLMATSATVKDPVTMKPVRFLVPGDPDHSRVYVRMFKREMPPGDIVGLPNNPNRPTISDISLMRQWITNCLGTSGDGSGDKPTVLPAGNGGAAGQGAQDDDGGMCQDYDDGGSPADAGAPKTDAGAPRIDAAAPRPEAGPPADASTPADARRRFDAARPG